MGTEEVIDTISWIISELKVHYAYSCDGQNSETERAIAEGERLLEHLQSEKQGVL